MGRGVEQTPNISVSEQLTAISVILQQIVSPRGGGGGGILQRIFYT